MAAYELLSNHRCLGVTVWCVTHCRASLKLTSHRPVTVEENWSPHYVIIPSLTMDFSQRQENIDNGVNGSSDNQIAAVAPGRGFREQQANSDRYHATVCRQNRKQKIATWNVRTLSQAGKLANLRQEMERLKISVLGVSEVRWPGSGEVQYEKSKFIYSGGDKRERGVGILLAEDAAKSLKGYWAVSDRIILVKLQGSPFDINIIQVYAPTADADEEAVEDFYDSIDSVIGECKGHEINIVMGDFNAKVGQECVEQVVGSYGLGTRNERGDRLVDWCLEHAQVVTNTWFKHQNRHLWTWRSPGGEVRNQIDFITINERFRNSVTQVKTYPGADINSDHVPVVATFRLKLKKVTKAKFEPKRNIALLGTDTDVTEKYAVEVRNSYAALEDEMDDDTAGERWGALAEAIEKGLKEAVPKTKRRKRKSWMTEEILDMMDKRRQVKGRDEEQYTILNREIHKECNKKKEHWVDGECEEVERLSRRNHNAKYDKIKELTHKRKWKTNTAVKNKDGTLAMEMETVLKRWSEYIKDLFEDDDRPDEVESSSDEQGFIILESEIESAMKEMKRGKAAGEDGVTIEMLWAVREIAVEAITKIANKLYMENQDAEQLIKSIFITIPKVSGTLDCGKHRTISIMSQITKIILKVILKRIRRKVRQEVAEEQYGFVEGKGTSNAIFILRMIAERTIEKQRDLYLCFIDYEKAFDRVKHTHLMEMLENIGIDKNDLNIIRKLYWSQKACVRVNGEMTEYQEIRRGVRQGCVLSPDLFSLYGEVIMRRIRECEGVRIGGQNINNIRFADDTVLVADTEEKLQVMLDEIREESERRGLNINVKKTESMVISKQSPVPRINLRCGNQIVKQVDRFIYLGSMITEDARCETEVKRRIGIAKKTFNDMRNLLTNRKLSVKTRKNIMKTYIWSTLLYGVESWTLSLGLRRRLEAIEMWLWRRMMKVPWTARRTNEAVLNMVGEGRQLLRTVRKRQLKFLGHSMRREGLENLALTGMVEGRRGRGRPREKYLDSLVKMTNGRVTTAVQLIRATRDRQRWKSMVADVLEDMAQR